MCIMRISRVAGYYLVILFSMNVVIINAVIGINWGRQSHTQLVPSVIIDLLLQNQIKAVKLFSIDDDIIQAFCGTDIEVTLSLWNASNTIIDLRSARTFVQQKIQKFSTVNFKYVLVGTNALFHYRYRHTNFSKLVDALEYMQSALDSAGLGHIKATFSSSPSGELHSDIKRPSEAYFTDDVRNDTMPKLLRVLNRTGAPFLIDLFPSAFITIQNLDLNFGFFDNKSTYVVEDIKGHVYRNLFEFLYDSFVWAIKKLGYENMKIVVGRIGWPTDGFPNANVQNAERFLNGLLPLVVSDKGTPMRPGEPIDVYLNALSDEKLNIPYVPYRRHWGIYRSNGEPKYKIDLTGKGRDIYPVSAKGINLMPDRWCMFNGDNSNKSIVQAQYNYACSKADCTAMDPFGSCSLLNGNERISYAFNAYFQTMYQDEKACDFASLASVRALNPSRDTCVFTVEVVKSCQQIEKLMW